MASYLIDLILLIALTVTALRSGRMMKELKVLRDSESGLAAALGDSDRSITQAAEVVVALKHDGAATLRRLETQLAEAQEASARLEALLTRADWHANRRAGERSGAEAASTSDRAQAA